MKKIILTSILLLTAFLQPGMAQQNISAQLSPLLTHYYHVKDALVSGNAGATAAAAGEFATAAAGIDITALPAAEKAAYSSVSNKLVTDAKAIAAAKDLGKQRESFKTFSGNFYLLAKAVPLSAQPVYQEYCPMKKAYWLSSSSAIKNPYYGSQMLTCGKVSDTIK